MSLACAALREGSIGVTITIFEVPGGGLPAGLDEEGELKMYQRKVKTANPLARYGSNDRRLRRRCVDERGVYGCGCEVLRGYGNCIIVNAVGGVVNCAVFVLSFYQASYRSWPGVLFRVAVSVFKVPWQVVKLMLWLLASWSEYLVSLAILTSEASRVPVSTDNCSR